MQHPPTEQRVPEDAGPSDPHSQPEAQRAAVEQFLQFLARAVHQFRTYPSDSPFCMEAVLAAQRSLASIEGLDHLEARVTRRKLIVDASDFGEGTAIERDLARPMHRASVGRLRIQCDATHQDLARFCQALIQAQHSEDAALQDLLLEQGVEHIQAEATRRPEIVEIGGDAGAVFETVDRERVRRAALVPTGTAVHHLYPPDRGWVRVDPSSTVSSVSLAELAILTENPATLAAILLRLSGDNPALESAGPPLERKFTDLATLFASLDPHLARVMFTRLSKAVLGLPPQSRTRLLKQTVLPGLLDGRADGSVLRDFPDVELADALCLLLELETASPEVLTVALTRLELPAERQEAVLPLLNDRLRERDEPASATPGAKADHVLEGYARGLIKISSGQTKGLAGFSAFDVSMDDATLAAVETICEVTASTDVVDQQLRCLCSLVRLEPNAERVETFLSALTPLMAALEDRGQPEAGLNWLVKLHGISVSLEARRPEVATCIGAAVQSLCTRRRATWLIDSYRTEPAARPVVAGYINALAPAIAPVFAALLDDRHIQANLPSLVSLICDQAAVLAPGLAGHLGHASPSATRAIVRALGCAGGGHEDVVAGYLAHVDAMLRREALEALVRMGTPQAARLVTAQIVEPDNALGNTAVEALWRFPSALVTAQLRTILRRDDFVVHNPNIVLRLLKRAHADGTGGIESELRHLASLRQRFWRPALMRVGLAARQFLSS
jgi:hypothetical protein